MALGNSHVSAIVREEEEFGSSVVEILSMKMLVPDQRLAFKDFRSVFTSAIFVRFWQKWKLKIWENYIGIVTAKAYQLPQKQRDWWSQVMEHYEKVSRDLGLILGSLSTDSLLDLVQFLKYLCIIYVIYGSVFMDWFFPCLWVNIFILLYKSSNFFIRW